MLEVVDELERNGQNLQHFAASWRAISAICWWRESPARRTPPDCGLRRRAAKRWREIAAQFSRRGSDALSAAGARYVPRSAVLPAAAVSSGDRPAAAGAGGPAAVDRRGAGRACERPRPPAGSEHRMPRQAAATPLRRRRQRTGPSPFELDRAKQAAPPRSAVAPRAAGTAAPRPSADWRLATESCTRALIEAGHDVHRRCIEQSEVVEANGRAADHRRPKTFSCCAEGPDDLQQGRCSSSRASPLRIKIDIGEAGAEPRRCRRLAKRPADRRRSVTSARWPSGSAALSELFGGEVRTVRNLKE